MTLYMDSLETMSMNLKALKPATNIIFTLNFFPVAYTAASSPAIFSVNVRNDSTTDPHTTTESDPVYIKYVS